MTRSVLAGFLFLFVAGSSASAQNCAAYPYPNNLMNGTNADASQVMGNFASILNCANNSLAARSGATFTGPTFFTGGNVGIGTTIPLAASLTMGYNKDLNYGYIQATTDNVSWDKLAINPNGGAVGIGMTNPTAPNILQVNGPVGATGYNTISDARLKKDIAPLAYGLDIIMKLRPVGFNWIARDQEWKKQHQVGLIAQEVESVVPEAVTTANDVLQTKSLAYSELVPVLIKAVQDLKTANDNLRAANDDGAAQIATLTARLDAIEAAHLTKAAASSSSRLQ